MRIAIIGAAGRVGSGLCHRLAPEHELVRADCVPMTGGPGTVRCGDIADPDFMLDTMRGAQASVYLPVAIPIPDRDPCDAVSGAQFDVNVRGVYDWLAAAAHHGVRRTVFASSFNVFDLRQQPQCVSEETPVAGFETYGLTKQLGEDVCRYFARRSGVTSVVLRLCWVRDDEEWSADGVGLTSPRTHVRDVAEAITLALTRPLEGFHLFHIVGQQNGRQWSIDHARQVLGFEPRYVADGNGASDGDGAMS